MRSARLSLEMFTVRTIGHTASVGASTDPGGEMAAHPVGQRDCRSVRSSAAGHDCGRQTIVDCRALFQQLQLLADGVSLIRFVVSAAAVSCAYYSD